MTGPNPLPSHDEGPAIWAAGPRPKRTIPVKVHCEKRYGSQGNNCKIDVKLFSADEVRQAEIAVKRLLNGQPYQPPQPKKNSDGTAAAAVMVPAIGGTIGLEALGGGGTVAAEGAAAAGTAGTATSLAVPAIIAGAALNPGQARWNEQNQLIQFGVEEEYDMTIHVVMEKGDPLPVRNIAASKPIDEAGENEKAPPKPVLQSDVASNGDPNNLPGGNNKKPIEPPPEKEYRTWSDFARDLLINVRTPNRLGRMMRYFRNLLRRNKNNGNDKTHPPLQYPEGLGYFGRRWQDLRRGFRETVEGQLEHWRGVASRFKGGLRTIRKIRQHPIRETLDMLNRPGKLWSFVKFTMTNGYALLRVATALLRRITGSDATNPIGSELFDEKYEPYVGVFGSGTIGAAIEHYIFGWSYLPSFIFSSAWGVGEMLVQDGSGGTGTQDCDWVRSDLATATGSALWGPIAFFYRWGKAAFPGKKWGPWLAEHPNVEKFLGWIPESLAPKRIPTLSNTIFTLLSTRLYINTLPTLFGAIAEDANMGEYYKVTNARLWTTDMGLQWFAMAWDPYLRTGANIMYTFFTIFQSRVSSKYFQIWKGERFYREPLKRLSYENIDPSEAVNRMMVALGPKDINIDNVLGDFGIGNSEELWNLDPDEWYDFFEDINTGYFTHNDIKYFYDVAHELSEPSDIMTGRIQNALKMVLYSYANSPVPHNWKGDDVSYEEEQAIRKIMKSLITPEVLAKYSTLNEHQFLSKIDAINK